MSAPGGVLQALPERQAWERRVLARALREGSAAQIRSFEETFEPLGLTALALQVVAGLWMG